MRVWMVVVVFALCASRLAVAGPAGADIVLLIDRAIPPEKLEVVTRSLAGALGSLSPTDQLAIVTFATSARVQAPLQPLKDGRALAAQINAITYAEGGNVLVGLRGASEVLRSSMRMHKRVLLITERDAVDGVRPVLEKMQKVGIEVSCVGYQGSNRRALAAIARSGGGTSDVLANGGELTAAVASLAGGVEVPLPVAVVFVIDRSGSMAGKRLDFAKEIFHSALDTLDATDTVAVIGVDDEATVFVRPQRAANRMRITTDVGRMTSGGGTNIYPGLKEAFEILQQTSSARRQVVVISDGLARSDGVTDLVHDMRDAQIMVSTVALDTDEDKLLKDIAEAGGGGFFVSDDLVGIPSLSIK